MDERWSEQKRRQDLDDLNNEAAGRDVGRIRRFRPDTDREYQDQKKRDEEFRRTALMEAMRDSTYAAAYQAAWDAHDRAQAALDDALLESAEEIERLEAELAEMESRAVRLDDGRLVFRDQHGGLRTADGHRLRSEAVPASLIETLQTGDYEEQDRVRDALTSARARGNDLAEIQTDVLDPAAERRNDHNNPLSQNELREMERQMDELTGALEEGRIPIVDVPDEPEHVAQGPSAQASLSQALDLPTLD